MVVRFSMSLRTVSANSTRREMSLLHTEPKRPHYCQRISDMGCKNAVGIGVSKELVMLANWGLISYLVRAV
jgi:hypothetical protein